MVIVNYTLDIADDKSLDVFDDVLYMAFGDDNTPISESHTGLINELLRINILTITKNTGTLNYSFTGIIPITKLNSSTVYEIGLFNSSTGGTMAARLVIDTGLTKTSDDELVFVINIETKSKNT